MELIFAIVIATILGFGLALIAPVSIHFTLNFDTQSSVTIGVQFLLFKHSLVKGKKKDEAKPATRLSRSEKSRKVKKKRARDKPLVHLLLIIMREHQLNRHILALFANFAKKLISSADRHYIKMKLSGGLLSPDLTGQLYGFVQACRSIPSDSLLLSFHPDFMDDRLRGTIVAGTVFRIYKIINQLIIFIWRLPKMKLIKIFRNYRKEISNV